MALGKERALVTPRIIEKWFEDLKVYVNTQDPTLRGCLTTMKLALALILKEGKYVDLD